MTSTELTSCCGSHRPGRVVQILYGVLLLWTKEMHGLSDFSSYLFRIMSSHTARGCDGERVSLACPRHSTVTVHSAFYGQRGARAGPSCAAASALQKMLSECQGRRSCQVLVHPHVFGQDPCPGTPKHLHVSYSCKPAEHKNRTQCEGDKMLLRCKYPKVLNIYSAVYGRELGEREACLAEEEQPPPFECLYHGAIDAVKKECYGKQRCVVAVGDHRFQNPCGPGTKKYLTVLYACVPRTLLKEADPDLFKTTSVPHETTQADLPQVRDSKLPEMKGIIVSSFLMMYGYIKENAEMAGLLFVSSVCLGLLLILLAVSTHLTCNSHFQGGRCLSKKRAPQDPKRNDDDSDSDSDDDDDDDESELLMDSSMISDIGRKVYSWEEVTYTTEAAELMERLERRDMIIQEIRMNAYLNGNSCTLY